MPTAPQRDPFEALAEEYLERHRLGEAPDISEYVQRHPELSEEIEELFPTMLALEKLKSRRELTHNGKASLGPRQIRRLGDFEIIREIGRGGMGIVYEAEQESLKRRVAIKVLPQQSLLDTRRLARFQREAQTAARLHHTHIVPVFGVGEADGYHFLVMQLIGGVALDAVIERLQQSLQLPTNEDSPGSAADSLRISRVTDSLLQRKSAAGEGEPAETPPPLPPTRKKMALGKHYWQRIARIGLQAATALDYAHRLGALHRDIKPGNLLLDEQGNIWVTDFGLAKLLEEPGVSRSGDVVGTLRYMAPEQLQGKADPRTDVYSLGLTLYELLTLQPAFSGKQKMQFLNSERFHQIAPPSRLNPEIPRDLETIVLKSLAADPSGRYASAGELADELERFLDDRPIHSRRASYAEKLWRWCRRNKTVSLLSGAALMLLILVAVTASAGYVITAAALDKEAVQRKRAETTREISLEALDRIYRRFAPEGDMDPALLTVTTQDGEKLDVPAQPALSTETASLLEDLLVFYDRLAEQAADDQSLREREATAYRRVGEIRQQLGQNDKALDAYERAIALYSHLIETAADPLPQQLALARVYNSIGAMKRGADKFPEATEWFERSMQTLESLPESSRQKPQVRHELAHSYYLRSRSFAFRPHEPPREPRPPATNPPVAANDGNPVNRNDWEQRRRDMDGRMKEDREQRHAWRDKAIALLTALHEEFPNAGEYRLLLAIVYREQSRSSQSEEMQRAIAMLEKLREDFPDVPGYQVELIETYTRAADIHWNATPQQIRDAETILRRALELSEELLRNHPQIPRYQISQVMLRDKLGGLLQTRARSTDTEVRKEFQAEATRQFAEAVKLQRNLHKQFPEELSYQQLLAAIQGKLARHHRELGEYATARELYAQSLALLEDAKTRGQRHFFLEPMLQEHAHRLADVLDKLGEKQEATVLRDKYPWSRHRPPGWPNPNPGPPRPPGPAA